MQNSTESLVPVILIIKKGRVWQFICHSFQHG